MTQEYAFDDQAFRAAMQQRDMDVFRLAGKASVQAKTIYAMRNPDVQPDRLLSVEQVFKVAQALDVPMESLLVQAPEPVTPAPIQPFFVLIYTGKGFTALAA